MFDANGIRWDDGTLLYDIPDTELLVKCAPFAKSNDDSVVATGNNEWEANFIVVDKETLATMKESDYQYAERTRPYFFSIERPMSDDEKVGDRAVINCNNPGMSYSANMSIPDLIKILQAVQLVAEKYFAINPSLDDEKKEADAKIAAEKKI